MRRDSLLLGFIALALLVLYWPPSLAASGDYAENDQCAACHEEIATAFSRTTHARTDGWGETHQCQACHGPGAAHIEGDGDISRIVRPGTLNSKESSAICLECHSRNSTNFSHDSALHNLGDVSCIDCHNPHEKNPKMLKKVGAELCAQCHQATVSRFDLPRSHPLAAGEKACVACHSPHAKASLGMNEGFATIKCTECHFEKAGPFIYNHDIGMVEGCQSCHQVHGTSTRHLLKAQRMIELCYQCHPGTTTPAFHSATNFLNEKCTACHTAIHGSNTNEFFLEE